MFSNLRTKIIILVSQFLEEGVCTSSLNKKAAFSTTHTNFTYMKSAKKKNVSVWFL